MKPAAWTCLILLSVAGCDRGSEPATSDEPIQVVQPADAPPSDAFDPEDPNAALPESPPSDAPASEQAPEVATPEPAQPAAPSPQRDLAAELQSALGSPVDCLKDYRPASATTIRVRLSAVVRPTGMIIEPSASGPGLSTNDRLCVEQRLGEIVLEPLSGTSSERVSSYVDIRYEPPAVESDLVAPAPPPAENVVPSLPKKKPIDPSGVPIEGPAADPIEGPDGVPIDGPSGVPIEGPRPVPIGRH